MDYTLPPQLYGHNHDLGDVDDSEAYLHLRQREPAYTYELSTLQP